MSYSPHGNIGDCFDPVRMGTKGAVVANHPLTAAVGLDVLKRGGNAADAAVAMGFAIGVTEPNAGGLGGDAFFMNYHRSSGKVSVVNGTGPAPSCLSALSSPERHGIRSVSVPGTFSALVTAHSKWGRLSLPECVEPSAELCERGVPVSAYQANMTRKYSQLHDGAEEGRVFAPEGRPIEAGEIRRNLDMARTYRILAKEGSDYFYKGPVAKSLIELSEQAGGYLQSQDLQRYEAECQQAISTTYRGHRVYEAPPNSTGCTLLEMLNIAENFDLSKVHPFSPEAIHIGVEAKRLAFLDREQYLGDPNIVDIPLRGLLSKDFAKERAGLINLDGRSNYLLPGNPWPYEGRAGELGELVKGVRDSKGDTTHMCVVDSDGNAVSLLLSLNMMFGAQIVVPGTGILLNNRMTYWHFEAGHPNNLMPGARVRHTMNPVMVFRQSTASTENLSWVLGTPGGDTQVQSNYQAISALIDHGCTEAEAQQSLRWAYSQDGAYSNFPHNDDEVLAIEDRGKKELLEGLADLGHNMKILPPWGARGSLGIIGIDPLSGVRRAASDIRRDGQALVEL